MNDHEKVTKIYEGLIKLHPEIQQKGKNIPYTSVNGHMFSQVTKEGDLGIRLPKGEREAFIKKYHAEPVISYGAVLKEYVKVPEALFGDMDILEKYLSMSYEYVKGLKPKK